MRTLFDAAETGYQHWYLLASGLIGVALGVAFVLRQRSGKNHGDVFAVGVFNYVWLGVATLFACGAFWTYLQYGSASSALYDGRAQVVEGSVDHFIPGPENRRGYETFCVEGKCFRYREGDGAGFNQTQPYGGPVKGGLHVRVTYLDDTIIRLESSE